MFMKDTQYSKFKKKKKSSFNVNHASGEQGKHKKAKGMLSILIRGKLSAVL